MVGLFFTVVLLSAAAAPVAAEFHHQRGEHLAVPCVQCHAPAGKPTGNGPGHAACQSCHRELSNIGSGPPATFCYACHVNNRERVFPPFRPRGKSDFLLARFDHPAHAATPCEGCHVPDTAPTRKRDMHRPSHDACGTALCHGGAQPAGKVGMADCIACHINRGVIPVSRLASDQASSWRVAAKFDHVRHAAGLAKSTCAVCHVADAGGIGLPVPRPAMPVCQSCHKKETSFESPPALCEKCHG